MKWKDKIEQKKEKKRRIIQRRNKKKRRQKVCKEGSRVSKIKNQKDEESNKKRD